MRHQLDPFTHLTFLGHTTSQTRTRFSILTSLPRNHPWTKRRRTMDKSSYYLSWDFLSLFAGICYFVALCSIVLVNCIQRRSEDLPGRGPGLLHSNSTVTQPSYSDKHQRRFAVTPSQLENAILPASERRQSHLAGNNREHSSPVGGKTQLGCTRNGRGGTMLPYFDRGFTPPRRGSRRISAEARKRRRLRQESDSRSEEFSSTTDSSLM